MLKEKLTTHIPDIRIVDPSVLKGKFVHLEIHENDLLITLDYEHGQFPLASVLRLLGMRVDQSFIVSKKMMEQKEFTLDEIDKRNLDMKEWKTVLQIVKNMGIGK